MRRRSTNGSANPTTSSPPISCSPVQSPTTGRSDLPSKLLTRLGRPCNTFSLTHPKTATRSGLIALPTTAPPAVPAQTSYRSARIHCNDVIPRKQKPHLSEQLRSACLARYYFAVPSLFSTESARKLSIDALLCSVS